MRTVVQINTCDYGSTGKIMLQLAEAINRNGDRCFIVVPNGRHNPWKNKKGYIKFGNRFSEDSHIVLGRITGLQGCFSFFSTLSLIRKLKRIRPDILHLHNLHESYINLPLLFRFIKKNDIPVVWTLHDCWSFTGHCPYFSYIDCQKWKTGCFSCPLYKNYPKSCFDNSKIMYKLKRKWFCGIKNLTLVTPSKWLSELVKESFLKEYPVKVINNGIDLNVFKPTSSDFRERHGIKENTKLILGVAFDWEKRKGLDVFIELSNELNAGEYKIVLVGTNDENDAILPPSILSIHRTSNQKELAEIYSAADVLINPTREDNYPTVNMEAIACGTPVITFRTGGSPEIVNKNTGIVVEKDDINALISNMDKACSIKINSSSEFDSKKQSEKYLELYRELV